jgi:hypothetical protein
VFGATLTTDRFGRAESAYLFDGVGDYILLDSPFTEANPTFDDALYVRSAAFWYKANDTMDRQIIYEEGATVNGLNIYIQNSNVWIGAVS